ncbi:hypothetical protein D9M71_579170 [compost metagenome]
MPPSAASTSPMRRSLASVKAPFSWPNSSDSTRLDGIEAQLNSMNGPLARGPSKCKARATSSLPVPVSPSTSTGGRSLLAMRRSASSNWVMVPLRYAIGADSPISACTPDFWASRSW